MDLLAIFKSNVSRVAELESQIATHTAALKAAADKLAAADSALAEATKRAGEAEQKLADFESTIKAEAEKHAKASAAAAEVSEKTVAAKAAELLATKGCAQPVAATETVEAAAKSDEALLAEYHALPSDKKLAFFQKHEAALKRAAWPTTSAS